RVCYAIPLPICY
uniref:Tigerinin-3 n=2 Tax=Hoplobatrachus tigerinus TaxID=103373 RepID=TIN3_HOPTI|nr:RecName: Full=Tigerinin-3 [Hoplobatrachus tigerinus]